MRNWLTWLTLTSDGLYPAGPDTGVAKLLSGSVQFANGEEP